MCHSLASRHPHKKKQEMNGRRPIRTHDKTSVWAECAGRRASDDTVHLFVGSGQAFTGSFCWSERTPFNNLLGQGDRFGCEYNLAMNWRIHVWKRWIKWSEVTRVLQATHFFLEPAAVWKLIKDVGKGIV
jgi:hypothetical protein